MKKNKLKLSDIEVSSFITTNDKEAETVQGGAISDFISLIPGLGGLCLVHTTAQATEGIHEITATVVRSQKQMDCAGATRAIAGCTNGGTFPCDLGCI